RCAAQRLQRSDRLLLALFPRGLWASRYPQRGGLGGGAATSDGSGGRPAARQDMSHPAATCADRSCCCGDQDARSSSSVVTGSPSLSPNPSETARVTVPPAAR